MQAAWGVSYEKELRPMLHLHNVRRTKPALHQVHSFQQDPAYKGNPPKHPAGKNVYSTGRILRPKSPAISWLSGAGAPSERVEMSAENQFMGHPIDDFMLHHINIMADYVIAPYRAPDVTLDRETARQILSQLCGMHCGSDLALCISAPVSHFPEDLAKGRLVDASPKSDFGRLMQIAYLEPTPTTLDRIDPRFDTNLTADALKNWREEIIQSMIEHVGFSPDIEIR